MTHPNDIPALATSASEFLARLVSFDTTSCKSNLELIDFVRAWLDVSPGCWVIVARCLVGIPRTTPAA
jgi:hypothetical protein